MKLSLHRSRALALTFLLTSASVAGVNSWTVTGPEGGPVASAAFHPTEETTALVGSARGVHLSLTQGAFWARMFEGDINDISEIAYDASRAQRVYARGNRLYRSDDDARTFVAASPTGNLVSMTLARDGVLYVLELNGRMFRSNDAGGQWTELSAPWPGITWPGVMAVDPSNSSIVYAGNRGGMYKSTNAGATWSEVLPGSPGTRDGLDIATRIAIDPTDGTHLVVATHDGLMRSIDGGASWTAHLTGASYVWVGFDPLATTSVLAIDRYGQIVRSVDRGATWPANLRPPRLVVHEAYAMAFSPLNAGHLLAATSEGPMFSDDGGATFVRRVTNFVTGSAVALSAAEDGSIYAALRFPSGIYTRSGPAWYPVNNAPLLDSAPGATTLRSVAVAARDSSRAFAIDMGRRLMRTSNAAATWIGPHPQFDPGPHVVASVATDPANPLVAYVSTSGNELYRTADGGDTWQLRASVPGIGNHLVVSASNPNVMYATALMTPATSAVFRSADAGITWLPTGALTSDEIRGITVDPTNAETVYAILPLGISKSTNGGTSWSSLDFGLPQGSYFVGGTLLVDPAYPQTLVASSYQPGLGFLRSVDGGATWQTTPLELGGARSWVGVMALNPRQPGLIVAGVDHSGLLEYQVSTDLGVTVAGLENRVAPGGSTAAQIVIHNAGPHAVSAAHVSMTMPEFLTITPPAACALASDTLECDLPAIAVGASRTIDLSIRASDTPSSGFFRVDLTSHEPDTAGGNNVATAGVMAESQSNLAVALSVPAAVVVGASTSFTATVTNAGPQASPNTHLEVALPSGVFAQTATSSQGTCVANGSVITTWKCELGTVDSTGTVTVTMSIRGDVVATHAINASVTGLNVDPATANDTSSVSFTVNSQPPRKKGAAAAASTGWRSAC